MNDEKTAGEAFYKARQNVWFDDGREERLLKFVESRVQETHTSSPENIISLIDEFGRNHDYLMNVGSSKGGVVAKLIDEHRPSLMLEFGSYIGYSTVLFAWAVKRNGGRNYVSFEREPKFAHVARSLVRLAGLSDIVRIVEGSSSSNIVAEHAAGRLGPVDMIFFDHYKPAYVRDLKICESLGLIKVGTVLAADNVVAPGNPTYLEYVRSTVNEKQQRLGAAKEKGNTAAFAERAANQYKAYESDDTKMPGVPELIYESRLVSGNEPDGTPDGIEITECKGSLAK